MDTPRIRFDHFIEQFPEPELPLTLGEETVRQVSAQTMPLSARIIEQFIVPLEPGAINEEFTEFVAISRLPPADNYVGLIYWRADLGQYHYTLVTLNPKTEEMIDRLVVAGTSYDGEEILQTSATITEALMVYQVSGQQQALEQAVYLAASSTARRFQIAESGKIIEL